MRRLTQRASHVQPALPRLYRAKAKGGVAHRLNEQGDGAPLAVGFHHRERHPLAVFVGAHDDELPRLPFGGDQRCAHQVAANVF